MVFPKRHQIGLPPPPNLRKLGGGNFFQETTLKLKLQFHTQMDNGMGQAGYLDRPVGPYHLSGHLESPSNFNFQAKNRYFSCFFRTFLAKLRF